MVINHLDKLFVTSDAATIVKELEVAHPAAKLVVLAAQAQEAEIGDGTNLVCCAARSALAAGCAADATHAHAGHLTRRRAAQQRREAHPRRPAPQRDPGGLQEGFRQGV